ncbi:MAG TPA: hypothetical protein VNR70_10775 [Steroidobacteraceae bacterium]|nr:hypothetical protein [Steroidobacteraceae bacterium]
MTPISRQRWVMAISRQRWVTPIPGNVRRRHSATREVPPILLQHEATPFRGVSLAYALGLRVPRRT